MGWLTKPFFGLCLFIDGIVYSLVAYAYKVFMIVSRINLNILFTTVSPIINRVKALIMVFILFKLAVSLLTYLLNPDDFKKGSSSLIKNIFIAVALLISSSFIFDLGNDISMLLIGSYADGSEYKVLSAPDDNNGLIARLVFGGSSSLDSTQEFGKYLSINTLNIFLNGSQASTLYNKLLKMDTDSEFDLLKITDLTSYIGNGVTYKYPLISTVVGVYLIYTIIMIAIQTGARALKLTLYQIIAPIPICTIIQDGTKSKSFQAFKSDYLKTLFEVAISIGTMYIATALVGQLYTLIMSKDISVFGSATEISSFTKGIVLIILIIAVYRTVRELPNIIGSIFPGFKMGNGGIGEFRNTMGTILGTTGGILGGAVAGGFAGSAGGLGGTLAGIARGAATGGLTGYQNRNAGAGRAAAIQSVQNNRAANQAAGGSINRMLGGIAESTGIGARNSERVNELSQQNDRIQAIRDANNNVSAAQEQLNAARAHAMSSMNNSEGISYGNSLEEHLQNVRNTTRYQNAKTRYEVAVSNGDVTAANAARSTMNTMERDARADYTHTLQTDASIDANADVIAANQAVTNAQTAVSDAVSDYNSHRQSGTSEFTNTSTDADLTARIDANNSQISDINNSRMMRGYNSNNN